MYIEARFELVKCQVKTVALQLVGPNGLKGSILYHFRFSNFMFELIDQNSAIGL